ncbi:MAG: cupin domain-containing protein [Bacteroidia bacterium]
MGESINADYWIEKLNLSVHPEGGAFKEIYRSEISWKPDENHPIKGERSLSTGIYYLLRKGEFSAFHRIKSDEIWHHYDGDDLNIYELNPVDGLKVHYLGKNHPEARPQICIPAGAWFASRVAENGEYTLAGCTVAPGFDFQDFELAAKNDLILRYPLNKNIIVDMTL